TSGRCRRRPGSPCPAAPPACTPAPVRPPATSRKAPPPSWRPPPSCGRRVGRGDSPVDDERLPGRPRRLVARQVEDGTGDVVKRPQPAHRDVHHPRLQPTL